MADKDTRVRKILVVDDDPPVLKLIQAMLVPAGYNVVTTENAAEALKMICLAPFDCLLTDAMMPGMSGYDLVRAIRKHPLYSDLPVIMLTRKRNPADVKKAVESGVTDYLIKPIDETLLLDKLSLCLKKGEGRRHVFEVQVTGSEANARMQLDCRVMSVSECDVTLKSPVELPVDTAFTLSCKLFDDIGIGIPLMKIIKNDRQADSSGDPKKFWYKVRLAFVGLPEQELMKIRAWAHKKR